MDVTPVPSVRVAVVQAEPVYFDLEGSVEKTIKLISEAASKSAKLVAFPEVWIPGYPSWIWARGCDIDLVQKYIKSSLPLKSPQMTRICEAAALHHIEVVLGYSERDGDSLYLGQSYIGSDGAIKCSRRKIKPTHMERTVFGDGSGNSLLNVVDRPGIGRVGMLCCWEHSQPLLKYHTHSQGEQIHVAAWPAQLPHEEGKGLWSTANEGSVNLSVTYAIEGGCFVLHTSTLISSRGVDSMRTADGDQYYAPGGGRSCVIRPDGKIISEFLPDDQEGLVITDLNMDDILRSKAYLDTQGHYSRPDLLWLSRNTEEMKRVRP
ncbi:carbon-nitrogen hydrolase [Ilyonectria robusta]|uniref:carbon-nitrogen hydrolase n=1 Tax=Ilyonectria robusta TaxID=1079257 RepID=UPI001E8D3C8D|nr:carbon-nitrogen hydrolase [Ilyonectria robusta]KAH8652578.1 carbon-nitrogen hydrolase [Ilyonectria robusta]